MKKAALINDLSGFGKCSLTAAIPVISVMGIQACPFPTAVLTAQTGFENYYCDNYTDRMDHFTEEWKKMEVSFDGIYSGFLADSKQIDKVLSFLAAFRNEKTLFLADPVLGDHGETYDVFSEELLQGMKQLTLQADVITPNLTELCLLADENYEKLLQERQEKDYLSKIERICHQLLKKAERKQTIIVTGIIQEKEQGSFVGNMAVSLEESFYVETPYTGKGFSGTGDLFASVICGALLKGLPVQEAVQKATYFLQEAIEAASEENLVREHGVPFEKYLFRLL